MSVDIDTSSFVYNTCFIGELILVISTYFTTFLTLSPLFTRLIPDSSLSNCSRLALLSTLAPCNVYTSIIYSLSSIPISFIAESSTSTILANCNFPFINVVNIIGVCNSDCLLLSICYFVVDAIDLKVVGEDSEGD